MRNEKALRIMVGVNTWNLAEAGEAAAAVSQALDGEPWLKWFEGPCKSWDSEAEPICGISFRVDKAGEKEAIAKAVEAVKGLLNYWEEDGIYVEVTKIKSGRVDPRDVLQRLADIPG